MSVYLVSICEITNFSEALSEYADISAKLIEEHGGHYVCLLYTSPSPRDMRRSRMPSSA